jgi:hypothetical protein
MPKINLTPYSTTTNNYELRTMNFQKQTQTKPILPARVVGKIALPVHHLVRRSLSEVGSPGEGGEKKKRSSSMQP